MITMINIDSDQAREVCNELADWLEQQNFAITAGPKDDPALAALAIEFWAKGFSRAIFEIRAVAGKFQVPDDISSLEP